MKELSMKEKAKAYDEALERAKNLHKDAVDMEESLLAKQCEIIFPELAESDDERIRKWLISQLNIKSNGTDSDLDIMIDKAIAWLEKQGEKDNWAEELNNRIKALHKQCLEIIQKYVSPCWEKMSEEDERIRKELIFYLGDMPEDTELRNGITNRDVLVWLEKQKTKV